MSEFKCEICEKEFKSLPSLNSHKWHCKKKIETDEKIKKLQAESKELEIVTEKQEEEQEEARQEKRRERIPLGTPRPKLSFDVPPGKHGRIINDKPGRLENAQRGGYEFYRDRDGGKLGDDDGNSDIGSGTSRVVGTNEAGGPQRGYLMVIDRDLYDQDQKAKQVEIDRTMESIKRGVQDEKPDDRRYVPEEGIKISREIGQ